MEEFWFYIKLGYKHVMDTDALDHLLFLCALAIPFTFREWGKVLLLATIFTIAHCLSLGLSVYGVLKIDIALIEFLIPITILLTAIFNIYAARSGLHNLGLYPHILATAFFGIIHGFGFSNYFNMLMAGEEEKMRPLLGFAAGIELSQLLILLGMLLITGTVPYFLRTKQSDFITISSVIVAFITVPLLIQSFPG
jgi:hypothetical protein